MKITPADPEPGDTFTITINGKDVSFVATDGLVATVVEGLAAAWNAATFPEATRITAEAVDADGDGASDYLTLTADEPGVPFQVSTSTIDAGGFAVQVTTIADGDPGRNEIQKVTIPGTPSGGTFTLSFGGQTTGTIAYNAPATGAGSLQTALEALANIVAGDVIVSGADGGPWTVEFAQNYATTDVPLLIGDGSALTGNITATVKTIQDGSPAQNEIQTIQAAQNDLVAGWRITWNGQTTGVIYNAAAAAIQADLEALPDIGAGNVSVTRVDGATDTTITVEFINTLGAENQPQLTAEGVDGTSFSVQTQQDGSATGTNEIQTIKINDNPTGGTFTVSFQGQTTATIAYNADAAALETALEALANITDVTVTKSGSTFTVEFVNPGAEDLAQMTVDPSALTGSSVYVNTTQTAADPANEIQQIALSPAPQGGTWTLTIDPGTGGETTAAIAFDADAAAVQTAIQGLPSFAAGDAIVSGDAGGPWAVEFEGTYAATDLAPATGDGSGLTGGGTQTLVKATTTRSGGPNHFDDPTNWTSGGVPNSQDSLFYNGGDVDCLFGLRQRAAFTADAGGDLLTFDAPADFREDQAVRLFTDNTLPAPLAAGTTYFVRNLDYDAGTCQLALTAGGAAIDITDAGAGTHTIALHLAAAKFHSRWTGGLGLTERNALDYYEYLPRSLAAVIDQVTIGEGEGDGQARLDLDTGGEAVTILVHGTGASSESGLPAVRWKGANAANAVTVHDGEFGAAVYATETAQIDALIQHAGTVQMGTVTIASLTKHGGELMAEDVTLAGLLALLG